MSLPLREHKARSIPKVRTKPRRCKAIKCRAHINEVLEDFKCALAGKVSKITGKMHECLGPKDPHHTPTRGAGGGDNNVVPLCRAAHGLIDSWDRSEQSVEEEYGVEFRPMGDLLWQLSRAGRAYRRLHQEQAPHGAPSLTTLESPHDPI